MSNCSFKIEICKDFIIYICVVLYNCENFFAIKEIKKLIYI